MWMAEKGRTWPDLAGTWPARGRDVDVRYHLPARACPAEDQIWGPSRRAPTSFREEVWMAGSGRASRRPVDWTNDVAGLGDILRSSIRVEWLRFHMLNWREAQAMKIQIQRLLLAQPKERLCVRRPREVVLSKAAREPQHASRD